MSAKLLDLNLKSKKCSKCGEEKPLGTGFYTDGSYSRMSSQCRACIILSKKDSYLKNKEKINKVQKICHDRRRNDATYYVQCKLRALRYKSKSLSLPFNITHEDILVPEYCPVLGIKLEFNVGYVRNSSPSVDRIIPSKGYIKGNVIVVSNLANQIKSTANIEQLKAVADFYCRLLEPKKAGE